MTPKDPFLEGTFWDNSGGRFAPGRFCSLPIFGNYYRKLYSSMIVLGEINYRNVMIGPVIPWKERICRLQLQFLSPCGTSFLSHAPPGRPAACPRLGWSVWFIRSGLPRPSFSSAVHY